MDADAGDTKGGKEMSNINKVRQEIERRAKFHDDAMKACAGLNHIALTHSAGWKEDSELLAFIDSLPEESCKESLQVQETCKENLDSFTDKPRELEKEINNYFEGLWPGTETAEQCNTDLHFTPLAIIRLASHFAEWGAKH